MGRAQDCKGWQKGRTGLCVPDLLSSTVIPAGTVGITRQLCRTTTLHRVEHHQFAGPFGGSRPTVGGGDAVNCAQESVDSCLQLRHAGSTPSGRYKFTKLLQRQRVTMTNSLSNGREMLTAEEVHDVTGVPVSTLHDWAAKRERGMQAPGPHHIRLSNRHRRWARKDVDQWIESARI